MRSSTPCWPSARCSSCTSATRPRSRSCTGDEHDAEHEDLQNQFRLVLADTRIPLEDRVRMSASFGVLFSGLFLSGEAFSSTTDEELGNLLRRILHDVLGG